MSAICFIINITLIIKNFQGKHHRIGGSTGSCSLFKELTAGTGFEAPVSAILFREE
jgi:hypothetical protein